VFPPFDPTGDFRKGKNPGDVSTPNIEVSEGAAKIPYTIADGLRQTCEWFLEQGKT